MAKMEVALVEKPQWLAVEVPKNGDLGKLTGRIAAPLSLPWQPGSLTVAMIVKNEALNIRDAIASFRAIADEIVVNDTGSTDGTQAILEELGVKWFQGDWRGDFSYARNLALDQATSSWLLWLDADDRIPEDQIEKFRKLKTAPLDRAFGFQVINTQGGLPIGGRFMQLRMFPNHPQLRFRYRIHEQVLHALAGMGLHLFYTETTIHHTGYEDPGMKHAKAARNLELLAQEPERLREEPALAMSVGDSHFILGEWEKGIEAYRRVWVMPGCQERHRDVYAEIPACIGRGLQHLSRREEALPWFGKSMALQPAKVEPVFYRAECLMEMGRLAEAEADFRKVSQMPLAFTTTANQYDVIRMYSFYHLARLLAQRGAIEESVGVLEGMHAAYDQVVESWVLLGQCRLRQNQAEAALSAFEKALALNPTARQESHAGRLQALRMLDKPEAFAVALAAARLAFPSHPFQEWPLGAEPRSRPSQVPGGKPRLSLCLIVKDEEKNLPACLDSAQGLAEEIIVVDTGSRDATQALALDRGAKVVESLWQNDFSLARNVGLSHARGDWILWLDADDRLPPESKAAIRDLVQGQPLPASRAFGFLVKNSGDGGLTGTVFNQIRLFPNRPDLRFESPIHEQILPAIERAGLPVEYRPITLLHTGYADAGTARDKQKRNRGLLEKQVREQRNVTPITLYTLGNACLDLGDFAEAETWFRESAALAGQRGDNPHVMRQVPVKLAVSMAARGEYGEAWQALQPALAVRDGEPVAEALLVQAQILEALRRDGEARAAYERLLDLREGPTFMPVDFALLKIKALQYLGRYWHGRGQAALAVKLLRHGLDLSRGRDFDGAGLRSAYAQAQIPAAFP